MRLVAALEPHWLARSSTDELERRRLRTQLDEIAELLRETGLQVSVSLCAGQAKQVLLEEAEEGMLSVFLSDAIALAALTACFTAALPPRSLCKRRAASKSCVLSVTRLGQAQQLPRQLGRVIS